MGLDTGAVNADISHVRVNSQILKDLLEDSGFGPLHKPFIHGLPKTVSFRKIPPGSSASENPADPVEHCLGIFG